MVYFTPRLSSQKTIECSILNHRISKKNNFRILVRIFYQRCKLFSKNTIGTYPGINQKNKFK